MNHPADLTIHDNISPQTPWSASFWFWWSFYGWVLVGLIISLALVGVAYVSFHRSNGVAKESIKRFNVIYSQFKWYAPVMVSDCPPSLFYLVAQLSYLQLPFPPSHLPPLLLPLHSHPPLVLLLLFISLYYQGVRLAGFLYLRFPMVPQLLPSFPLLHRGPRCCLCPRLLGGMVVSPLLLAHPHPRNPHRLDGLFR